MKRLAIVAGVLALICVAAVRAQECTDQNCIYLPAAQQGIGATVNPQSAPTLTLVPTDAPPITGATPTADGICSGGAPPAVEGAQVWVKEVLIPPGLLYFTPVLCVRLAAGGRFVTGFTAQVIVHGTTRDEMVDAANSASGVASVYLQSTNTDYVIGQTTQVDVAIPYLDRVYVTRTSFRPLILPPASPTTMPTPTNTPIPTVTSTPIPPTITPTP